MKKEKIGYFILLSLAIAAVAGIFLLAPLEQDEAYHHFCDEKTILNIPNFWNVVSNLPFLIVGLLGVFKVGLPVNEKLQYWLFFFGVALVSFGSGYYHLNPNNTTLIWDRLPMTIAFMALFSMVVSEFIDAKKGQLILFPILLVGLASVFYWVIFDDLKIYAIVQFYPILAIPVILIFFKSNYNLIIGYWLLVLAYVLAKILEHYDCQIYQLTSLISGHTLKHIFASIGLFILLYTFIKRKKVG